MSDLFDDDIPPLPPERMTDGTRAALDYFTSDETGGEVGRYLVDRYYIASAAAPLDALALTLQAEAMNRGGLSGVTLDPIDWRYVAMMVRRRAVEAAQVGPWRAAAVRRGA